MKVFMYVTLEKDLFAQSVVKLIFSKLTKSSGRWNLMKLLKNFLDLKDKKEIKLEL
jgi:hypothetical protein